LLKDQNGQRLSKKKRGRSKEQREEWAKNRRAGTVMKAKICGWV